MNPRITILNRLFWPKRFGGLEHVLWRYANALADAGAHIHVVTESIEGSPTHEEVRGRLAVQRHAPVEFGRLWRVGELVQARWWKRALAQAPPSDIYWANEPTAATAAIRMGLAGKLLYRPVFCYEGLTHAARTIPEMQPLGRSLLARRLDRYAYRRAAMIIDESNNLRRQHEHWYGPRANTHVIPNPADAPSIVPQERERFGLAPHHFVIGFVGRPGDPCKDLPFLISALKNQPLPDNARLLVVGGGNTVSRAQQWIREAGLSDHTIWTGDLEDPAPAYAAMDMLVLPSRFETFGNVIVEAHAHGVPAIARADDHHANPPVFTASAELIDDGVTGFVVDPHDPNDMGSKLLACVISPEKTKQMGYAAKVRSKRYTWADAADRYLQTLGLQSNREVSRRHAA